MPRSLAPGRNNSLVTLLSRSISAEYPQLPHFYANSRAFTLSCSTVMFSFPVSVISVNKMLILCWNGDILPPVALVWCVIPVVRAIRKNYIATHQHQP